MGLPRSTFTVPTALPPGSLFDQPVLLNTLMIFYLLKQFAVKVLHIVDQSVLKLFASSNLYTLALQTFSVNVTFVFTPQSLKLHRIWPKVNTTWYIKYFSIPSKCILTYYCVFWFLSHYVLHVSVCYIHHLQGKSLTTCIKTIWFLQSFVLRWLCPRIQNLHFCTFTVFFTAIKIILYSISLC